MKHLKLFAFLLPFALPFFSFAQQQLHQYALFDLNQSRRLNPAYLSDTKWSVSLPNVYNQFRTNPLPLNRIIAPASTNGNEWRIVDQINRLSSKNEIRNLAQIESFALTFQTEQETHWTIHHLIYVDAYFQYPKALIQSIWESVPASATLNHQIQLLSYHELGVTFAKQLEDALQIGIRFKLLNGIDYVGTERNDIRIQERQLYADYQLNTSAFLEQDNIGNLEFNLMPQRNFRDWFSRNFGYAFDLGIHAKMEQWQVGMSILDLGQVFWKKEINSYSFEGVFSDTPFDFMEDYLEGMSSFEAMTDSLRQLFEVEEKEATLTTRLFPKVYGQVSYLPSENWQLSAVLYGEWFQDRFSPAISLLTRFQPNDLIRFGLSYSIYEHHINQIGASFVWYLRPFQVFFISNNLYHLLNWKKHEISDVQIGVNVLFGSKRK
ncbi:MAG: DUF5723 family protein [Bacteroidota bacterium]